MSKSRKTTPDAVPEADDASAASTVSVVKLSDYLTVKRPETADDLRLKEAVHAAMQRVWNLTSDFVDEKLGEGLSLEEILAFYELVSPVAPTVETMPDGRLRVNMDVQIVEKEAGE